jgi:hypothetical protein
MVSSSINHIFLHRRRIHVLDDLVHQGLDRLDSSDCPISVAGYHYYYYQRRCGHVIVRYCCSQEGSVDFLARLGRQSERLVVVAVSIAATATPLGRY